MLRLDRGSAALLAILACMIALVACSTDPLTDSLRPTADDRAAAPGTPPAGTLGALLRVGEATRQAGDPANAIPFFRRAHALDPFKAAPLVRLGVALNDLGQFNEAAQAFRDALNLEHNNTEALRGLGYALIGLNQPEMAIDQFKAAIAIEPDYRSYNGLGVASDHLGEHKAAQDYYNTGLKIYPNNLTLLNNLGLSQILSHDYDSAIATLVGAVQQPGASARQRQNLALAYGMASKDAEAARIAKIDLSPRDVESNLAYYGILRGVEDKVLLAAILGVHAPDRLAPQPAPSAPQAGAMGDSTKEPQPPAPPAKPNASVETVPAPVARAEPTAVEPSPSAAKPATGTSHFRSVAKIAIPNHSRPAPVPAAAAVAAPTPAAQAPESPVATNIQAKTVAETPATPAPSNATEATPQPAAASQRSDPAINGLATNSQLQEEAATQTAAPPNGAATATPGQASAAPQQTAASTTMPTVPSAAAAPTDSGGAPVWYAAALGPPPANASGQENFLDRFFDFLFRSKDQTPTSIARLDPDSTTPGAKAPATAAISPPTADLTAVQPAAGGVKGESDWLSDIGDFFRAKRGAMASPPHQPIGGGVISSP